MPTIYLDLDDVLCDTAGGYLELVRREFARNYRLDDIHSFDLQHSFGLSDEENRRMFRLAHSPGFITALRPLAHSRTVLSHWRERGCRLAIVTGRHTMSYRASLAWLRRHDIPYDSFTMVDKYGWPETDYDIAVPLRDLEGRSYDLAIEDNPEMADYLAHSLHIPVLLHARPWNRTVPQSKGIRRFADWRELPLPVPPGAGHQAGQPPFPPPR